LTVHGHAANLKDARDKFHRALAPTLSNFSRSVPWGGVRAAGGVRSPAGSAGFSSGCRGGQRDEGIIAQWCDGFQCHVARPLDRPFVVLFEQDGADQAGNGLLIGEDADNLGAALDLAV